VSEHPGKPAAAPENGQPMSIVAGGDVAPSDGRMDEVDEVHPDAHGNTAPAPVRTPGTLAAAGDLLRALAAPVRIAIVLQLRESSRCVHDLVDALGVTQPLISQHLRVLKSAGVVRGDRHGREVVYSLVDDHLSHIVVDAVEHAEEVR
jgi:ArsR family transcriptional regulator, zinc-responsive transcriptional repressor